MTDHLTSQLQGYRMLPYRVCRTSWIVLLLLIGSNLDNLGAATPLTPFFAYELGDLPVGQQTTIIRDLGFDGIAFDDPTSIPERLAAVDAAQVQLFFLWTVVDIKDGKATIDPRLEASIRLLKGRSTVIWLAISGANVQAEELAVKVSRRVADLAAESNLRVALYPHFGFYLQTFSDVLRVSEKAQRSNLGVTFNLCHELHSGLQPNLNRQLSMALPKLFGVTINGADRQKREWPDLIQPLDRGDFDVKGFVETILSIGYRGPIGLQCWGIGEDARVHLARSMKVWRTFSFTPLQP